MSKSTIANAAADLHNYALDALKCASAWVHSIEEEDAPLKDAKAALAHLAKWAPEELKPRLNALATVRTKKGFAELAESLESHTDELRTAWMAALEVCKKESEAQAEAESKAEQGSELDQLASLSSRIHALIEERMANTLAIGEALSKAKGLFGKQTDFLVWADSAVSMKKAQVYKWIKVWDVFGGEPLFANVAMRVLYTLSAYTEDSEVFKDAVAVLDAGETLDSTRLTAIIQEHEEPKPAQAPATVSEPSLVESEGAEEGTSEAAEQAAEGEDSAPWDDNTKEPDAPSEGTAEPSEPVSSPTVNPPVQASELTRRDRQIEELTAQVAELTKLLAEAQKAQTAPVAPKLPALPQFDQACPFAVLGLSRDASGDAAAIKRAHRSLAKLYSGQPEISEKLMNARTALLSGAASESLLGK